MNQPRLIQTYLPDGTLEGVRVIELSESSVKAFVIPRMQINAVKDRPEIQQPALYILFGSAENEVYIGESENFYHRIKNHEQSKPFWDIAVAIISNSNSLEKSDVKYLESLAIEKAQATAAMKVINKTIPARNNIHEFKVHTLQKILDDTALVSEMIGFSVFTSSNKTSDNTGLWFCHRKGIEAKAEFRGSQLVVLAGSTMLLERTDKWAQSFPNIEVTRQATIKSKATINGNLATLTENIPFRSVSLASGFMLGTHSNGWIDWKNSSGQTMDEVIRKGDK